MQIMQRRASSVNVRCEAAKAKTQPVTRRAVTSTLAAGLTAFLTASPALAYGGQKQLAAMDAGFVGGEYGNLAEIVKRRRAEAAAAAAAAPPAPAPAPAAKPAPAPAPKPEVAAQAPEAPAAAVAEVASLLPAAPAPAAEAPAS